MNLYALFFGLALFGFCSCDNDDSVTLILKPAKLLKVNIPTPHKWNGKRKTIT